MSQFASESGNAGRSIDTRPLQEWADSYTSENKVPGILVGVYRDGREVAYVQSTSPMLSAMGREHVDQTAAAASGMSAGSGTTTSTLSSPVPAPTPTPKWEYGRDTAFRIFSMTKPMTSVCISIAVEQGKMCLDDPVAKYIPGVAEMQVDTV